FRLSSLLLHSPPSSMSYPLSLHDALPIFSGGEPLARDDLEDLVAEAHALGYYVNLITSGIGLNEQRIRALKEAGLDHIQLSFQRSEEHTSELQSRENLVCRLLLEKTKLRQ